jgi:MFS family permease
MVATTRRSQGQVAKPPATSSAPLDADEALCSLPRADAIAASRLVYAAVSIDYFAVGMMRTLLPYFGQQLGGYARVAAPVPAAPHARTRRRPSLLYRARARGSAPLANVACVRPRASASPRSTPFTQGLLEALYGAGQVVGSLVLGRWSDGRGRKPGLAVSFGGSALGYALVAIAVSGVAGERSLWLLLLSRLPVGARERWARA